MKNVGKRGSLDERPNQLERERFEPFQQNPDLHILLDALAQATTHDRTLFNYQSPDYYFDDAINPKQPNAEQSSKTFKTISHANNVDDSKNIQPFSSDEQIWHNDKQHALNQLQTERKKQKQQRFNGQRTQFVRQWDQQADNQFQPLQQQKPTDTIDNNENFMMQSLNTN